MDGRQGAVPDGEHAQLLNNGTVSWSGTFSNPTAQDQAARTDAGFRWMQSAKMTEAHAKAVVHRTAGRPAVGFGPPALLLNGDSHVYGADMPLADPPSATGKIHKTQAVPNLTGITVQGPTPHEWMRLAIDPRKLQIFSGENVPYCKDPLSSCKQGCMGRPLKRRRCPSF